MDLHSKQCHVKPYNCDIQEHIPFKNAYMHQLYLSKIPEIGRNNDYFKSYGDNLQHYTRENR